MKSIATFTALACTSLNLYAGDLSNAPVIFHQGGWDVKRVALARETSRTLRGHYEPNIRYRVLHSAPTTMTGRTSPTLV